MTSFDGPSAFAASLLDTFASCNERLIDLTRELGRREEIRSARHSLEIRRYESGPMIEAFVDAELSTGKAAVWGLELSWGEGVWKIDHFVRANDRNGQYSVREFESLIETTLEEALRQLRRATEELVSFAREAVIASY